MEPIRILQSQKRVVQSLLSSLFAFALFGALILFDWENTFALIRALAVVCVPVFGAMSIYAAARLFQKDRPLILLDERGLFDDSSPFAVGLIRWEEICGESIMMYNNLAYLRVEVAPLDAVIGRLPALRRLAVRARLWFMRAQDYIPVSIRSIDLLPDELLGKVSAARQAATGSAAPLNRRKPAAPAQGSGRPSSFNKYDC